MAKNKFLYALLTLSMLMSGCASNLPNAERLAALPVTGPPEIQSNGRELPPAKSKALMDNLEKESGATSILTRQLKLMEEITGKPIIAGNEATLLTGPEAIAMMLEAIRGAKDNINLETYTFSNDKTGRKFAGLLLQKQAEGVQVNLIYDSIGSIDTPAAFFRRLRAGGVNVIKYNLTDPFHRDHRKILVVDGKTAFTGGVNITSDEASSGDEKNAAKPWKDADVMIQGPAVAAFQRLFYDTWKRHKGPILPEQDYFPPLKKEGDDYVMAIGSRPGERNRLTYLMYYTAFSNATNYIHVTAAYFVPNRAIINALTGAAMRGVDVQLILATEDDVPIAVYAGQSYYTHLLKSGVRIYQLKGRILHAKTAVIDGIWSTVGSTNLDMWSFANNKEVNAVIVGKDFAGKMEAMFENDLRNSKKITLKQWRKRSIFERFKESLARLFANWL